MSVLKSGTNGDGASKNNFVSPATATTATAAACTTMHQLRNTLPAAASASLFTARHQEALDLELSLLVAALKRNGAAHGRTQYHRRLTMAVSCLRHHRQRQRIGALWSDWHNVFRILKQLQQELEKERKLEAQTKKRQEIFWELKVVADHKKNHQQKPLTDEDHDDATTAAGVGVVGTTSAAAMIIVEELTERVADLAQRTVHGLPECLSRLEHAAKACFAEIGRGFFLALLTVTVACTARIRTLLLRLQRHVAAHIRMTMPLLLSEHFGGDGTKEIRQSLVDVMESIVQSSSGNSPLDAAAVVSSHPKVLTRAELTAASLRSLGIVLPEYSSVSSRSPGIAVPPCNIGEATAVSPMEAEDTGEGSPFIPFDDFAAQEPTILLSVETAAATVKEEEEEQDTGENVGMSTELLLLQGNHHNVEAGGYKSSNFFGGTAVSLSVALKSQVDDAGVDQNAVVLEQLKHQKKKAGAEKAKKSKKEKRRRHDADAVVVKQRKTTDDTSSKAKSKKLKKSGDFFDELFG